jgi:hypothetical protein
MAASEGFGAQGIAGLTKKVMKNGCSPYLAGASSY